MAIETIQFIGEHKQGTVLHFPCGLGNTGYTKASFGVHTAAMYNGTKENIASGQPHYDDWQLVELGNSYYDVVVSGSLVNHLGINMIDLEGAVASDIHLVVKVVEKTAQDLYADLDSGALPVSADVISMGAGVVTAASIAANAITDTKIASDAITNVKIADNAISAAKIASDAITAAKILDGAITDAKIATSVGTKIALSVWDYALTSITTVTSIGYRIKTFLDIQLSVMSTTLGLVKTKTDQLNFDGTNVKSAPQTAISMSTADKNDIVARIFEYTYKTKKSVSGSFAQAINWMGSYAFGKRGVDSNGLVEEVYEENGTTLASTHNITRDSNGRVITRSARF